MNDRVEITYREFYDVPRLFVVATAEDGALLLFDGRFDDAIDEYPDDYDVFALPPASRVELSGSWLGLREQATTHLGRVPVSSVSFDPTRKRTIDAQLVRSLVARLAPAPRVTAKAV